MDDPTLRGSSADQAPFDDRPHASERAAARDQLLSAILASDLAAEVRMEFNSRRADGLDVTDATHHAFSAFRSALGSPHDGPVVLLALAALQLRDQALHSVLRDAALDVIDSGEALAAFPAPAGQLRQQRHTLLDQFANELREATVEQD